MSKRGIIGRVAQLAHANVNALIDSAEDPQQVLDELVRSYAITIAEAEQAVAQLTGNRRIAEDDQQVDAEVAELWSSAAEATSQTADELRAAGDAADADAFDNLAKVALARQLIAENDIETLQHTITAQTESVQTLANGLDQMQIKASELEHKRDDLAADARSSRAQPQDQGPVRSVDIMDPASEVDRFREIVRREEARVRGAGEVQAPPPAAQFAGQGDEEANRTEIEERLKALKTGRAMASALARAQDQQDERDQPPRRDQPLRRDQRLARDQPPRRNQPFR
jgi:phage shock protein A